MARNFQLKCELDWKKYMYRQNSNIRCTKSQHLNVSHLVLQLSLCNILKPGDKSRMKMYLEQHRQAMLQLHPSDQQYWCLLRCGLYWRFYGICEMGPFWCDLLRSSWSTEWSRDKMDVIVQIAFWDAFSWIKTLNDKYHWNMLTRVQLTISHLWFR